ncbi:MAG: hypothetical protein Q9227_000709 [Pyrenula ochraceoflavens]
MQSVKNTVAENLGGVVGDNAHAQAGAAHQFSLDDVPDQSGKVAVITGGSEGIGYATSFVLLRAKLSKLFMISVDEGTKEGAMDDISSNLGPEVASRVTWFQCDMSDWHKVAQVAKEIASQTDRIDILINNAARGIMTYQLTPLGVDRHMAINHMAHVILTSHLLPLLKQTASSGHTVRIQNQASNAHQATPSSTKFASLAELNTDLGANAQYGRSKLANILYSRYLARHLTPSHPKILANATHPGFVETKMSTDDIHEPFPIAGYAMSKLMKPIKKDQWMGAVSTLYAATVTEKSGEYICPPAVPEPGNQMAQDEELGEQLMRLTREVVKEKTYEQSAAKGCPFKDY